MQIQAYQQPHVLADTSDKTQNKAAQTSTSQTSATIAPMAAPKPVKAPQHGAQMGQLLEHLKGNKQVQNYVKQMIAAIDSGNFNTQKFASKAPAEMQRLATKFGIDLPQQLNVFHQQLLRGGQQQEHLAGHPQLRFLKFDGGNTGIMHQLAAINTNA
ncbi:hypothetical protein [Celerinatantimonas sp. MCCC 1A17872]|uniref:hypothetical protein n=1 Tax=Celerinatantimonas sp. MCCC 1A17872 TaxID=3177514 RepID=UPI0038C3CBF3